MQRFPVISRRVDQLQELANPSTGRGVTEAVPWVWYDTLLYDSTVTRQHRYFQQVAGLGVTNMEAAGSLPAPKSFLIQTIELYVFPTNTIAADGTTIAAAKNLPDIHDLCKVGWLELYIGSKAYLQEGPLMKFPPRSGITGLQVGADSTANTGVRVDYASLGGPVYELDPWVLLVPTQNFVVSLNWASAVNINANCTIVCNLGGILYRNSQ